MLQWSWMCLFPTVSGLNAAKAPLWRPQCWHPHFCYHSALRGGHYCLLQLIFIHNYEIIFFFCFTSFTQNKGQECKWTHGNQMHMRFWLGPKHVLHSHWGTSQQPPQSVSLWGQVNSLACRAGPVPPLQNVIKKKVNGFTHTFYKVLHYSLRNWRRKRDKRLGKAITSPDQRTDHKE